MPADPDPAPVLRPTRAGWPVYAERPRRRARQFLADVAVLAWVAIVVSLATLLYDAVLTLQGPGRQLGDAGANVRDTFAGAAETAGGVPFVGDDLARALSGGTRAGENIVAAGEQEIAAVEALASGLAWTVGLIAVVPVVVAWVVLRVRWMIAARAVLALRDGLRGDVGDADLLALRALSHGSPRRLARVPDAAAGWRRGDPRVLARLAEMELGRLGLRGPTLVRAPAGGVPSGAVPDETDGAQGAGPGRPAGVDPDERWGDTPPPPGPRGPLTS
ncbi:hypothetical protein [Actinomycetospora lemnae]|uniref:RDD family protein n=1 Tax=Actinomycetospora lemnae TaxID=3019891 RepID=A0ABT5SWU6_9PSEU|nr:hypothetical protein [Actinomycetospora sp. DW7H6]MDD7967330.1 hypothetical protein [Actinomycetospora sp. DW7H6]